jgi:hypothetical protein
MRSQIGSDLFAPQRRDFLLDIAIAVTGAKINGLSGDHPIKSPSYRQLSYLMRGAGAALNSSAGRCPVAPLTGDDSLGG